MCGLAGFIDFAGTLSKTELLAMNAVQIHRGPDAEGIFLKCCPTFNIGLTHRRLSIIDLSESANQPMVEGDTVVVFNGEIYNFNEIKEELKRFGYTFKTNSDTEVIIKSYIHWGIKCVHKFIGMFAIVLWDQKTSKLFLMRDRAGVKPLYYYWDGIRMLFSSELKSIMAIELFPREIDKNIIAEFLTLGYINSEKSIFKNVKKVLPGSILEFDLDKTTISAQKYWSHEEYLSKNKVEIEYNDALIELENKINEAINYRLVADVPIGVFLSGGYDSTLVTAMLQRQNLGKINTFTIGVEDQKLNEAVFARKIAEYLGTSHNEIICTSNEMFSLIEKLPNHFDEPFADSSALATMLVSSFARQKVTVALSADGGDELFAGYNRYDYLNILKLVRLMGLSRKVFGTILKKCSKENLTSYRISSILNNPSVQVLGNLLNTSMSPHLISNLFVDNNINYNPLKSFLQFEYGSEISEFLSLDYITYLPNDILTKVDRSTMAFSLEGREPLLDHNLFEFVASLPDNFKHSKKEKKIILKDLVHKYVPKELMDRPKMGFAVPIKNWLNNELQEYLNHYLGQKYINEQGIFKYEQINQIISSFQKGQLKNHEFIWYLLMFQMWYNKWME